MPNHIKTHELNAKELIYRVCRRNASASKLLIFTADFFWSPQSSANLQACTDQLPPDAEGSVVVQPTALTGNRKPFLRSMDCGDSGKQLALRAPEPTTSVTSADSPTPRVGQKRGRQQVAEWLSLARDHGCDMTLEPTGAVRFHCAAE